MPKGATFEADMLNLILNGIAIAGLADNAASSPLTTLYASLHTASPGASGTQNTNEIAYTGYARYSVSRSPSSPFWTISGSNPASAAPNSPLTWPNMTGGAGGTATYLALGTSSSGAGKILWYGAISPTIAVASGVTPTLSTATVVTEA